MPGDVFTYYKEIQKAFKIDSIIMFTFNQSQKASVILKEI